MLYRRLVQTNRVLKTFCPRNFSCGSKYDTSSLSQKDYLTRLHIPKSQQDIKKQLDTLGKYLILILELTIRVEFRSWQWLFAVLDQIFMILSLGFWIFRSYLGCFLFFSNLNV